MNYETAIRNIPNVNDIQTATRDELVKAHLKVVPSFCAKYRSYGIFDDLVQACNLRMLQVADRFDPSYGVSFYSFIQPHLEYAVKKELMKFFSGPVNKYTTKTHLKIFRHIDKYRVGDTLSPEAIDQMTVDLNVTKDDVYDFLMRHQSTSTDITESYDVQDCTIHPEYMLDSLAKENVLVSLESMIQSLPDRERDIIQSRILADEPTTLDVLSKRHSVSIERIRQLEKKAAGSIQKMLVESGMMTFNKD